jgi:superfamily II RNA helicase
MIVPGVHQNPELIHELIYSSPEPINSQIHINFSMTLNLLLSQEPKDIKKLLERSLAAFQERGKGSDLKKRWEMRLTEMAQMIPRAQCDIQNPKTIEENIGKVRAQKKAHKINNKKKSQKKRDLYAACLEVGRIFSHKNGKLYAISACYNDHGRMVYEAYKITGSARDKKKGMRPVRIQVGQIKQVYNDKIKIRNGLLSKDVLKSLKMISPNELVPLYFSDEKHSHGIEVSKSDVEKLDLFPCYDCAHWRICHGSKNKDFSRLLRELLSMVPQMEGMAEGLWISFNQHLRFLVEAGFADKDNRLTQDGIWASKLRLDQPLLIAEAIKNGAFENIPAAYLAAGLAPFVWDRSQEIEFRMVKVPVVPELERYFERIINSLEEIIDLKTSRGFENQPISFWPTAALYLWAKGASWEQLTDQFPVNEGDLAALIVRTADHLRQVINLAETHPELASLAKQAIGLILREPVYIY